MAVDTKKMRKQYEESKRGGDLWNPENGETKVYVHPPCREDDSHELTGGLNYIPLGVHYAVGKNNQMVICLDSTANPVLTHPFLRPFLKKRGIKLPEKSKCDVCREIESGALSPEEAERSKLKQQYMWGVTPTAHRASLKDEWRTITAKPSIALVGRMVYEGLVELYAEVGDVSDPAGATLAKIGREGKGLNTKYKVSADSETTKKPLNVKKDARLAKLLEKALLEGGDCDLFRVVANMIKAPAEVKALLSGVKLDESDTDDEDAEEREEDDEAEVDSDASDDGEDDEKELEKPKKKAKPAPKAEDDEEAEEEDEEEEATPPPKKKAKPAPAPVEDDEDEEAEEEDEEEEAPPPPKKKAKPAPVEDDEDEEEAEEDGEEEVPAPPKKKAKPAPVEEDEEEEEAPAPKKAKKGTPDDLEDLDSELDRLSKKKKSA